MDEFEAFYRHSYGNVVGTLALAVGNRHQAEEAAQEAFARAFRRWRVVGKMDRPDAWVMVVAMNVERRRFRREGRKADGARSESATSSDHASSVVARIAVAEALATLTERQRAVVVLRYLGDLPFAEVAKALGCAEGTARATLHQALAKLRIDLTDGEL